MFRGPSEDILLALSHTLNYFVDGIEYLLTVKGFEYALTRRKRNDPKEHLFSASGNLGSNYISLDVSALTFNE